jgi:hypothetical protein
VEHLGGHEVAEVVEPEGSEPGAAAVPRKVLVTRLGFQAVSPPSSLNTKPSRELAACWAWAARMAKEAGSRSTTCGVWSW